jgi:hypothetical protein
MRLFKPEEPRQRGELLTEAKLETTEALAAVERRRVEVMHRLAEIGEVQKAAQREMRQAEREMKALLKEVPAHPMPEERDVTLEDVEAWMRSEFNVMTHTAPRNPHTYFSKKKCREPEMYEKAVEFILRNGYVQRYGGDDYTVLDVRLHDGIWYAWPMIDSVERLAESEVLNLKPDDMRPE